MPYKSDIQIVVTYPKMMNPRIILNLFVYIFRKL